MEPSQPANSRPESSQLATFRSTVRHIESILRQSTISTSDAEQIKSQLAQFHRLLEAQEVRGQSGRVHPTATTSRPNPLARLPELCLLALFGQLPLLDQLTARQTCARWSTLMLEVTQTRRSLDIILNDENKKVNYAENHPIYKGLPVYWLRENKTVPFLQKDDGSPLFPCRRRTAWSRLSVASLPATLNQQICTTFSRIKKLKLNTDLFNKPPDKVEHLVSLMEQLSPRLEAFHLYLQSSLLSQPLVDRLFAAINSMSSLLYLKLELDCRIPHRDLPIISRLEELHFNCQSTTPDQFAEMLQRHGEGNGALRRIVYRSSPKTPLQLAPFSSRLSRRLRDCFTRFVFYSRSPQDRILFCGHFRRLTSFDLYLNFIISIRDLFAQLSQLTQLTSLRLELHFTNLRPDGEASQHRRPLPQLPSVTLLYLQPGLQSHRHLDHLALPWTMPNLQVICFDFLGSRCTDCHETVLPIIQMPASLEPVKECTRQLFRPLMAQCTRLQLISHSEEVVLGTAEELLA